MGELPANHKPNLLNTQPVVEIGPYPSWNDPKKIVSIDPFGHVVAEVFDSYIKQGIDIRPSIAITKAHMQLAEIETMVAQGEIKVDGKVVVSKAGQLMVTKGAVEPVWFLPGIAERFKVDETVLRRALFEDTGGMYPELITRPDLKVFLPPIGGLSIYIFGPPEYIADPSKVLTVRVHDECNGSDVFGSDICTCRPYLIFGIAECVKTAQNGGVGLIVYFRKEGRALGEVTKYLVYNARKRAEGGDTAANYFLRTENVAGVKDMRFQATMPDVLHWLGITKIDRMISMSNMKYDAIVAAGIPILDRIPIPPEMLPPDSQVEIDAKVAAGYFSTSKTPIDLEKTKGRVWYVSYFDFLGTTLTIKVWKFRRQKF
jgi:GTP cyclohydrolase II